VMKDGQDRLSRAGPTLSALFNAPEHSPIRCAPSILAEPRARSGDGASGVPRFLRSWLEDAGPQKVWFSGSRARLSCARVRRSHIKAGPTAAVSITGVARARTLGHRRRMPAPANGQDRPPRPRHPAALISASQRAEIVFLGNNRSRLEVLRHCLPFRRDMTIGSLFQDGRMARSAAACRCPTIIEEGAAGACSPEAVEGVETRSAR